MMKKEAQGRKRYKKKEAQEKSESKMVVRSRRTEDMKETHSSGKAFTKRLPNLLGGSSVWAPEDLNKRVPFLLASLDRSKEFKAICFRSYSRQVAEPGLNTKAK